MSRTPDEIFQRIRAQLAQTMPGLSMETGTPEAKIVAAVSEAISEAYVDQYLVGSLLDIETKVGLELEQYVGIFGYGRIQGDYSKGVVRISLKTAAPQDFAIPLGSQFYTKNGTTSGPSALYFSSTQAMVLTAGSYSIDVPVECNTRGTIGNLAPDSVTYIGSAIGTGSATNLVPMTGGVDAETDAELRQRFKDTMLRNIAGTADWYKALCMQNNRVSRTTVFGATTLYRTQIAAPATTLTVPVDQNVRYCWADMHSAFTNLGQEDETFYSPIYDYSLSSGASPVFTRNPGGEIETDQIIDLEFQYVSKSSRNDPVNGITNKVDCFVDGIDPTPVTEKTVVLDIELSSDSEDPFYTGNFARVGDPGSPTSGNRFMRLGSVPIVAFPDTITVDSTVFTRNTHYYLLRDATLKAGSHLEVSGIEWEDSGPADDTELTLPYTYNRVPELLAHVMSSAKQITSDVMVHQASFWHLRPCLSIQYDRSYSIQTVDAAIDLQLKSFFGRQGYGTQMRISTLTMAVQQVLGVIDCKLTTSDESAEQYGVEIFYNAAPANDEATPDDVMTEDFRLDDNALPVFIKTVILRKAAP